MLIKFKLKKKRAYITTHMYVCIYIYLLFLCNKKRAYTHTHIKKIYILFKLLYFAYYSLK